VAIAYPSFTQFDLGLDRNRDVYPPMDPLVILGRAKNESTQGCVYFKLLGEYQPSHGYSL
jgi:hypothetical protein